MDKARKSLDEFVAQRGVQWIPDDLPARESHPQNSKQVTDHYLADLAPKHGLKLATLDRRIPHPAVEVIL